MLSSTQHQSWLFYLPLAQQAALLKDDLLEPVDHLLNDSLLVDLVRDCLASRRARRAGNEAKVALGVGGSSVPAVDVPSLRVSVSPPTGR